MSEIVSNLPKSGKKSSKSKPVAKDLNVSLANQSLWLVKIPQFVAEQWNYTRDNEVVGSLKITMKANGPNVAPSKQLNVKLISGDNNHSDENNNDMPDEFTLEEVSRNNASSDSFVAFTADESSGAFSVDGRVTKNLLLKPQGTKEYRHLIRARGINKLVTRRETHVANVVDVQRSQAQSHTVEFITSEKTELKRRHDSSRGAASKAARLGGEGDNEALRSKMFEAFGRNERQPLRDLMTFCQDVPGLTGEKDLRDLLDTYAKYNRRGIYKQLWELKPEYRDYNAAAAAEEQEGAASSS